MRIVLMLSIILLFSCKKNEMPAEEPDYWGTVTAEQNDEFWEASRPRSFTNIVFGNTMDYRFTVATSDGFILESLFIANIPFETGTFPVYDYNDNFQLEEGKGSASFSFRDHDVQLALYLILESDNSSFFTVESYDTLSQEVKGSFDLTFKKESGGQNFPDTVRFRNGIFHTKVIDL